MSDDGIRGRDAAVDGELAQVADALRRITVQVADGPRGGGSGVIWETDGVIVTNAHVARGSRVRVTLWDGREIPAAVRRRDERQDLAELEVDLRGLPARAAGNPSALRPGELVLALGNPLGMVGALAVGIVHDVAWRQGRAGAAPRWIRADIRLAPGNSGGPLADAAGRVVGVNAMIAGGLGVAIPTNVVERFLSPSEERPKLGIVFRPVMARIDHTTETLGLLVLEIAEGSAAAEAGFMVGDAIIGVDGRRLASPSDVARALGAAVAGSSIAVDLLRGGYIVTRHVSVRGPEAPSARAARAACRAIGCSGRA